MGRTGGVAEVAPRLVSAGQKQRRGLHTRLTSQIYYQYQVVEYAELLTGIIAALAACPRPHRAPEHPSIAGHTQRLHEKQAKYNDTTDTDRKYATTKRKDKTQEDNKDR